MWVEPIGVEQCHAEPVARHKAARFDVSDLVVDLCAGSAAMRWPWPRGPSPGRRPRPGHVPSDPMECRVYDVADRSSPVRARAETFPIPAGAWLHLDPDRRATPSSRARSLDDYAPGPLSGTRLERVAAGAIKLSPASDFAAHFPGPDYEVELISLRGECKEATVWFGELVSCRRRATRLPEDVTWTDRDGADSRDRPPVSPLSSLIYDPDPSLLRAGLLDGFALAHRARPGRRGVDYLTGEQLVSTPFLHAFEVRDVSPLDLKHCGG